MMRSITVGLKCKNLCRLSDSFQSRTQGQRVDHSGKHAHLIAFHSVKSLRRYDEVYNRGLKVMDLTATAMCKENNLPIIVFDMDTPGNLARVLAGESIGTLVTV